MTRDRYARTDAAILFSLAGLASMFAWLKGWPWVWPLSAILAIWGSARLSHAARPPLVPYDPDLYALASVTQCKRCGPGDWGHCTCAAACDSPRCAGGWVAEWEQLFTAPDPAPRKDTPR